MGLALVDLLEARGLHIDKADDHEPVRKPFNSAAPFWVREAWPTLCAGNQYVSNCFLFKGTSGLKFNGMAVWNKNLPPQSKVFNNLTLWINRTPRPDPDFLRELADALFIWSDATSGFVTDESLDTPLSRPPELRKYLSGLYWLNYFGPTYLSEPDFPLLPGSTRVGRGMRSVLADSYDDGRLKDEGFLSALKQEFGLGWFAKGPQTAWRLPKLDFSLVCRPEV